MYFYQASWSLLCYGPARDVIKMMILQKKFLGFDTSTGTHKL